MDMNLFALPDGQFVVPPAATPRARWTAHPQEISGGGWPSTLVNVHGPEGQRWTYRRNYVMLDTFHPFRQLRDGVWREYALISPDYTRTAVLDLSSGQVIAVEEPPANEMSFCPRQFHVPDWWDADEYGENDGTLTPDCDVWEPHMGACQGNVGFVAGCVWGDDYCDKLQVLDLSRISEGVVVRSAPFGYVELPKAVRLRDAVTVDWECGRVLVAAAVSFSCADGTLDPWSLAGAKRGQGG